MKTLPSDWTANKTVVEVRLPNGRMVRGTVKRAWNSDAGPKLRIRSGDTNYTVEAKRVVRVVAA